MSSARNEDIITEGTTNVFAVLGFALSRERQTKTRLAFVLNGIVRQRRLKQVEVAKVLHIPQPKVSALKNYRRDGFSVERLLEFLRSLVNRKVGKLRPLQLLTSLWDTLKPSRVSFASRLRVEKLFETAGSRL